MSYLKHIKPSVQKLEAYRVTGKPFSPDLIKLNQNENPFDLPEGLKRELLEDFMQFQWNRYPEVLPSELTHKLSETVGHPAEGIIVANGSNELMYTILMTIVGRGVTVVIPSPTFFLYEKIVHVLEGTVVPVPMKTDFSFDTVSIIEAANKEHASLIILNSPNSPTGQSITIHDIENILDATDSIVIVDEAYIEFSEKPSAASLIKNYDRLIILRTFSKAFSLAGLRIGYLIAHPMLCTEILKPKIPFTVNNLSQHVAVKLLGMKGLIDERITYIKQQKNELFKNLSQIKTVSVFPSDTNFLIFRAAVEAKTLLENLLLENVLVRDVSTYPMLNNMLRVNAGTETENKAFIAALKKYL